MALLAGAALVQAAYQIGRAATHPSQGLDFGPAWVGAKRFFEGEPNYLDRRAQQGSVHAGEVVASVQGHTAVIATAHLPYTQTLFLPLAAFSFDTARRLWMLTSLAFFVAGLVCFGRVLAPDAAAARRSVAAALLVAAFFFPFYYDLFNGQQNSPAFFGLGLTLLFWQRGRPWAAGASLAAAASFKLFPLAPALWFALRREWRVLAALALTVAGLVAFSLGVFGLETWQDWWVRFREIGAQETTFVRSHSIDSALRRLLSENVDVEPLVVLAPGVVDALSWIGRGAVALLGLGLVARRLPAGDARLPVQFGVTLLIPLLCMGRSWIHYQVYLLPLMLALVRVPPRRHANLFLALLGGSFAVLAFAFQGRPELDAVAHAPLSIFTAAKCVSMLVLLGLASWILLGPGEPDPGATDATPTGLPARPAPTDPAPAATG